MIAAGDIIVNYLTSDHALACFRENEDVFFILSFNNPKPDISDANPNTLQAQIFFHQFRDGTEDNDEGFTLYAVGDWYKDTGVFISKRLAGSESGGSFEDSSGKLLINDPEILLKHSIRMNDGSHHDYELAIRRSTLRFNERISNQTLPPTQRYGFCVSFSGGFQDKSGSPGW